MNRWIAITLLSLSGAVIAGCANIPRQSAELSGALTAQIEDLQKAHVALLNAYFDEVETRMRQTITGEYKDALVQTMKDKLKAKGKELTLDQYDIIIGRVLTKQNQVVADLEKSRSEALGAIMDRYVLMHSESQTIQALLESASKLQEARQKYTGGIEAKAQSGMDFLKSVDAKVQNSIDEVNQVKEGINKLKQDASEVIEDAKPR